MNERSAQEAANAAADAVRKWTAENHSVGGVCDFCSRLLARVGIAATYVTSGNIVSETLILGGPGDVGQVTEVQDPFWAACPACDQAIEEHHGDPAALAEYVWEHRDKARVPSTTAVEDMIHRGYLVSLYRRFFALDPIRVAEEAPNGRG